MRMYYYFHLNDEFYVGEISIVGSGDDQSVIIYLAFEQDVVSNIFASKVFPNRELFMFTRRSDCRPDGTDRSAKSLQMSWFVFYETFCKEKKIIFAKKKKYTI